MRITVGGAGSIAIAGVAFATFLSSVLPLDAVWLRKSFLVLGEKFDWQFGIKQVVAVLVARDLHEADTGFSVAIFGEFNHSLRFPGSVSSSSIFETQLPR